MFSYDMEAPLDIQLGATEHRGEIEIGDITYAGPVGDKRIAAYLVAPSGAGPFAGVLFVHWYESHASNSNRTQFIEEAVLLAERGTVSLLVETMWSRPEWYGERRREDDYTASIKQTVELRRALDVLLAQPGVDPARIAVVGHDFGGMFGAILAGVDRRARSYAIIASTPLFSDWYLYGEPMPAEQKSAYVSKLAELDPAVHIAKADGASFLFQFANEDFYVPVQKAHDFYDAAPGEKQIEWYEAGHDVAVPEARRDRFGWLIRQLAL